MGRRKKNDNAFVGYLIIFALALSAVALIAPIIFLGWWLVSEVKNIVLSIKGSTGPSEEEAHLLNLCRIQINENNDRILALRQAGSGIMKRTDGMFDGRDTVGRELNARILEVQEFQDAVSREKEKVETEVSGRVYQWAAIRAETVGLRLCLVTYVLVVYCVFSSKPGWLQPLGRLAGFYLDEKSISAQMIVGASLVGAIVALVVMFIFKNNYQARLLSSQARKFQLS